ncbi:MAG: hypothetical protein Kow00103_03680 [Candidatus Caldatribacteriota bacterium]
MKKLISISLMLILFSVLLFVGCAGPPLPDCPEPDASKITASRGTIATGGMIIQGEEGTVEPGATVTITDTNGKTVTTTADENGSFTLLEADLPEDFDHTIGNTLSITQKSEGCNESSAVEVAIIP